MTFEGWYKENLGNDTWWTFSYDDLKDAWEDAYRIGFNDGKDEGDHEV